MKLFYDKKKRVHANQPEVIADCIKFIEESLIELRMNKKTILKAIISVEETVSQLINYTDVTSDIVVRVKKFFGNTQITVSSRGDEYDPYQYMLNTEDNLEKLEDEDVLEATRAILIKAQGANLKFSRKGTINKIRILVGCSEHSALLYTTFALILGILFGVFMRYMLPVNWASIIEINILDSIKTMFMNALNIIIAPVVFFSIVSCFSQFKNISELGRIGLRVIGLYLFTSIIAIVLALGVFAFFHPGNFGCARNFVSESCAVNTESNVDISVRNMFINIVPSNFIKPFLEADTLQLICLAVLCGVALGMINEYSTVLQNAFEGLNALFLAITTIISRFIPIAVFCSVAILINNADNSSFINVVAMAGTYCFAILCMLAIYGMLLIFNQLNPLIFFRKNREGMVTSLLLSSSSVSIPVNIKTCTDKFGVSPKICNFSIPFGATINMDASCIFMIICGLFMARIYGNNVSSSKVLSLVILVILLSMGCPGVPGSGIVYLGIILKNLNVPIESLGLIIGINPFLDMLETMCNTSGDVAATLVVARKEKMLNMSKYTE